ncbi:DinB family protein [Dyadobacter crusticola]|uniref:DinB family protein n=1 Tax=Dyadobacter crusticola TaxID=292407 RepID=UPI0004E1B082|nr:DinB family protein [Dyadobacter crusticola]
MSQLTATPAIESSLAYLMQNYADYNHWANCTLINWLKRKPRELVDKEVLSSFSTIRETLIHIVETQRYWLSVINPDGDYSDQEFDGDLDETFSFVMAQSQELAEYVETLSAGGLVEETLVVSPWFECNFPKFEYILHCMNHSTYHRGQIVTMGRNLGFTDAPMTDYNFYNVVAK